MAIHWPATGGSRTLCKKVAHRRQSVSHWQTTTCVPPNLGQHTMYGGAQFMKLRGRRPHVMACGVALTRPQTHESPYSKASRASTRFFTMGILEHTAVFAARPATIWALLAPAKWTQWDPDMKSVRANHTLGFCARRATI